MLDEVVAAAVELIPAAQAASISLAVARRPSPVARRQISSPHRTSELPGWATTPSTEAHSARARRQLHPQGWFRSPVDRG